MRQPLVVLAVLTLGIAIPAFPEELPLESAKDPAVIAVKEAVPEKVGVPDTAFFPLAEGTRWVYKTTHKTKKDVFDMVVTVDGPWKEKDKGGMILKQRDKRGQMREFLLTTDAGVFIYKLGLKKSVSPEVDTLFTPPVPRVMFPLTPGTETAWKGRLKVAWVDKPITFKGKVVGWEEIEVPAGKFRCIRLHYDQTRGEEKVVEDAWYAEGVGQVKYDGGEYIKELKEFKKSGDR
jgi:hypothetical protein